MSPAVSLAVVQRDPLPPELRPRNPGGDPGFRSHRGWRLGAVLALLLGACLVGACGSSSRPSLRAPAGRPALAVEDIEAPATVAPWQVPPGEWGSQRLFQMVLRDGRQQGRLRLTARLAAADRYGLSVSDSLGRRLWTLDVHGERTVVVNHRRRELCSATGSAQVLVPVFGAFAVGQLPALVLGRLPAEPAADDSVEVSGLPGEVRQLQVIDASGRRWSARLAADGTLQRWWLEALDLGAEPPVSWHREPPWVVLADHRRDLEVRWQQVVAEPLAQLPDFEPPAGYRVAESCPGESEDPLADLLTDPEPP